MTDETEITETAETETEEKPERPAGLPDHFDSVEALAASYKELHGSFTRRSQELAELARENERISVELEALLMERDQFSRRVGLLERLFTHQAGAA